MTDPGAEDVPIRLSQRIERPQIEPYERRVRDDGVLEEWSALRVEFVDGETRFLEQEPKWRPVVTLSSSELEQLEEVIAATEFPRLAGEHLPERTSIGGSVVTWTALVEGERYAVILHGAPAVKLREIDELAIRFEQIVAGALNREREERPEAGED